MATLYCYVYVLGFFRVNLEDLQTKYNNLSTYLYDLAISGTEQRTM